MKNEEAVMREYKSGAKSGAEIAATLGIGRNRVWGVLKKHGISERDFAERNKAHPDAYSAVAMEASTDFHLLTLWLKRNISWQSITH